MQRRRPTREVSVMTTCTAKVVSRLTFEVPVSMPAGDVWDYYTLNGDPDVRLVDEQVLDLIDVQDREVIDRG